VPLDHYRTLGASGLRVSPLCLGSMTFGQDWGWGAPEHEAQRMLDWYLDAGGNFIDTANEYTKGHSEAIIGERLGRTSRRDRIVIATKFFGSMWTGDPNAGGAGRKSLINACEHSLRRLQTDYIDLYQMHCWDRHTPIEETMETLDTLVKAGKVRYIGFSNTPAWKVAQAQTSTKLRNQVQLASLQVEYSLIERTVEGEIVPAARELGLGLMAWSPLKWGVLSGKYTREKAGVHEALRGDLVQSALTERAYDIIDVLLDVAAEMDMSAARVALAWVRQRPGVTSTIVGARTVEQLEENLASVDVELSQAHLDKLLDASAPQLNYPHAFIEDAPAFCHSGTTVNGVTAPVHKLAPTSDAERY
jgi:aryl-alcohol dehydrogenase-like predicted oxidoreductase